MRIGIFTDTYPPFINGVSTSIALLEKALEKEGHEVFIVTVNSEDMKYKKSEKIVRVPGIPVGIYDYRLTGIYPVRAINKIKSWNLDVIHSHTEFGVGIFARIISKQFNIPLVHTYHTMYEDYIYYITKGFFDKPSKKVVEYLTKFYCDITANELIVPTKKTYDLFMDKYKVDQSIHIIPTGIELDKFYKDNIDISKINQIKANYKLKSQDFITLFVGRLAKEKSVSLLIEGHASVVKKNKNAKLIIVGDGPDSDSYKKLAEKLKIKDNVIFTGKIPWDDVPIYYQLADIFATASRSETQGLTVIEAMAASLPVVAADDDSFKTIVLDEYNGFLFKNKRGYQNAVLKLMTDSKLRKKLSISALNSSEKHSSKFFGEQVLKVYEKAIGERREKNKKGIIYKIKKFLKKGDKNE